MFVYIAIHLASVSFVFHLASVGLVSVRLLVFHSASAVLKLHLFLFLLLKKKKKKHRTSVHKEYSTLIYSFPFNLSQTSKSITSKSTNITFSQLHLRLSPTPNKKNFPNTQTSLHADSIFETISKSPLPHAQIPQANSQIQPRLFPQLQPPPH